MNWTRVALAGVVSGVVANVCSFIIHGILLADTYVGRPDIFEQTQASPFYFLGLAIGSALVVTVIYAKTMGAWGGGWKGGAKLGFWVGLVGFFPNFYYSLVIADFPYYLSWCWGSSSIIVSIIGGAVIGALYKP